MALPPLFPPATFVPDRRAFILDACRGKRVLHLGCVERPLAGRVQRGGHLHLQMLQAAEFLVGLDIDASGLEILRARYGVPNLYQGDVEEIDRIDLPGPFDVIVAGELIEHLSNPGRFLDALRLVMTAGSTMIITTPNAFALKLLAYGLVRRERSSPDHTLFFSFSTLRTLLRRHGYVPVQWVTALDGFYSRATLRGRLAYTPLRWLFSLLPHHADQLICLVSLATRGHVDSTLPGDPLR